jgi:RNA polymerase sigma-70 factor (ECF subfamily)
MARVLRMVRPAGESPDASGELGRLVAALARREPWAASTLVERFGPHVQRILVRVLGSDDADHKDLVQEVFARAFAGLGRLADPAALEGWLTNITVFTAREAIRRRQRRRWLLFFGDDPPEVVGAWADPGVREAARCVYRVFADMPVDERIPFALRMLEGMELKELAAACGMSLATTRRRLARAERRFRKLARRYEALAGWLEAGP